MLPKIMYPTFDITVPSTKKIYRFRPFLVKEEKILLMAKAADQKNDMLQAIKQVVNNCLIDGQDLNVDKISIFDLELLFLKLRAGSVSDTVKISYRDVEDSEVYDFEIDLNSVEVIFPESVNNTIKISADTGFTMKYPEAGIYDDVIFLESGGDAFFQLIVRCIDKIYDKDNVYPASDYTSKQLEEFLENLDVKTFESVKAFMLSQPKLSYTIKYTNKLGKERTIELNSLSDFFILR
jgi:hypothetical protein